MVVDRFIFKITKLRPRPVSPSYQKQVWDCLKVFFFFLRICWNKIYRKCYLSCRECNALGKQEVFAVGKEEGSGAGLNRANVHKNEVVLLTAEKKVT